MLKFISKDIRTIINLQALHELKIKPELVMRDGFWSHWHQGGKTTHHRGNVLLKNFKPMVLL